MVPDKYATRYFKVKYFFNSYRALADGRAAIEQVRTALQKDLIFSSEWRVPWIGACTLIRSSIDLFRQDEASCLHPDLRVAIADEWKSIRADKKKHAIFWEFLRKERDSIIHHYNWSAYEVWMDDDGNSRPARISLLDFKPQEMRSMLMMQDGLYKGRDSLELLQEGANWAEQRVFSFIERAGFSPNEQRNPVTFELRPKMSKSILGSGE